MIVPSSFVFPQGVSVKKNFSQVLIVLLIPILSKTFGYQFNSLIINSFIGKVRLIRVKASFSSTFALSL